MVIYLPSHTLIEADSEANGFCALNHPPRGWRQEPGHPDAPRFQASSAFMPWSPSQPAIMVSTVASTVSTVRPKLACISRHMSRYSTACRTVASARSTFRPWICRGRDRTYCDTKSHVVSELVEEVRRMSKT